MGVRPHVSCSPIKYDAKRFEGFDSDRPRHFRSRLSQEAEYFGRIIARNFPESSVDLHTKIFALDQFELECRDLQAHAHLQSPRAASKRSGANLQTPVPQLRESYLDAAPRC